LVFLPVSSKVNFPQLEERILAFWKNRDIVHRVDSERKDAKSYVLYDGPPTANASPGIHHVLARIFKDVMPRYKTMKGYRPVRRAGWDTHGLPVELEIERELGISTKSEIEAFGVGRFNDLCRQSVMRYVKEWETMTERIGYWLDMDNAYITFDNSYIETCWWIIKQLWSRGLIYKDMKGTPHCPRCVTSLSSHEVALGYAENTPDPSVFVKFALHPLSDSQTEPRQGIASQFTSAKPVYLVAWTTTPWTLPANTGLAVSADTEYSVVERENKSGQLEWLIVASPLVEKVLSGEYRIVGSLLGKELVGLRYEPLFDPTTFGLEILRFTSHEEHVGFHVGLESMSTFTPKVIAADFVSMKDGTGIVHIAPAFGDEDLSVGRAQGLAFLQPVDLQGKLTGKFQFAGKFVKDADEDIMKDLAARDLIYRREVYLHTYPFCWRCRTPLIYYAKSSWYIRTTAFKDELLAGNQEINWHPDHIKDGRFGDWLRNNIDWAISRERYWGTPIPVWQCDSCGEFECLGSIDELRERAIANEGLPLDLHRPHVDNIKLICEKCGGIMGRIPEVLDCWFDAGAMPLAQEHYPFDNPDLLDSGPFPADYICEAVDQTRGWFYTLLAISILLTGRNCYRNAICLGLIVDDKGEKMSKSRGNVVEPWSVLNTHGADALRWYLFTVALPGSSRRFSMNLVGEVVRGMFLTLWNVYAFFVTYANVDKFNPRQVTHGLPTSDLDRWIFSELNTLVAQVERFMEEYNPTDAGRRIEEFVELLSNWYVRRSRRRFWRSENDDDKMSGYITLYTCLTTLSRLLAPFTPFLAEELHQNLVRSVYPEAPESVHMSFYPQSEQSYIDEDLSMATRLVMRLASLGRSARSRVGIKVRQPLGDILVKCRSTQEERLLGSVSDQLLDELNIKKVSPLLDEGEVLEYSVRLNMELLGPKYGSKTKDLVDILNGVDSAGIAAMVRKGQLVTLGEFTLSPEELIVSAKEREGYSVASEGGYTVAIDKAVTKQLADEGLARELVHNLQNMRRSAEFDITDHIIVNYEGDIRLLRIVQGFGDYIKQETLAETLVNGPPMEGAHIQVQEIDGVTVTLGVSRVQS
jgi:isoleucyl-tRNA synthetase